MNDVKRENSRKRSTRIERLRQLVQERNAQIILCNNPETFTLVEIGIALDQAVKRLRNRIITSIPAEDAIPVFENINRSLIDLETATSEAAQLTGMTFYRTPRSIKRLQKQVVLNGDHIIEPDFKMKHES